MYKAGIHGRDYFTERSGTELGSKIRNGTERCTCYIYIIDGFVGSETLRPTVVNGGAGGAASDEEQWGTFF